MTVGFGGSIVLRHPIGEVFSLLTDPGSDTNRRYMQRLITLETAMTASSLKDELTEMIKRGAGVVQGAGLQQRPGMPPRPVGTR